MRLCPKVLGSPVFALLTASLCVLLLPRSCSSAQTALFQNKSISGNKTLVSDGGMFEFGLFDLNGSHLSGHRRHYLGIWYHNITPRTVVWVANRDNPFPSSSGIVSVLHNGLLVVRDENSDPWWSSGVSSDDNTNYSAMILPNGNLVVAPAGDSSRQWLWQSFEQPTATFLPGMTLTRNKTFRTNITAWKSSSDPSAGNYSLFLDPRGMYQLLTVENINGSSDGPLDIWWRSGPWTSGSKTFNGVTKTRPMSIFGFDLTPDASNVESIKFTFVYSNNNTRIRYVLLPNGTETTYIYDDGEWRFNWSQPAEACQEYNYCGYNTMCRSGEDNECSCLEGFEPRSATEWKAGNRTGGCLRRAVLPCGDVGFRRLSGMKLPDLWTQWTDTSFANESSCRDLCRDNCSCAAYAYPPGEGCFTWGGDLIDVLQFTDGINGEDLHIKVPNSAGRKLAAIVVPVVAGVVVVLAICLFWFWRFKWRVKDATWRKKAKTTDHAHAHTTSREEQPSRRSEGESTDLPLFSLHVVRTATDNFSESNALGKGGFGRVYMGILPSGESVAVKRLAPNSCQGMEEFENEMMLIAKLQHNNLVRLQGYCAQGDEKILLYEYMSNKSLDAFIFDPTKQTVLDWRRRFDIMEGIARGLLYLHRDSRLRIVHRDLKASNILLDQDMNPKISDFGMARIFGGNQNDGNTNRVVGTFGYMSPEYAMEGLFSVKSDVYSFGVLVLEIVSGCKNNRVRSDDFPNLLAYAWQLWREDRAMELLDPSIRSSCSREQVLRCVHVALLCVQDRPNDRPTMSQVIIMLGSDTPIETPPRKPTFASATSRSGGSTTRSQNHNDTYSTNDVTITTLTGR